MLHMLEHFYFFESILGLFFRSEFTARPGRIALALYLIFTISFFNDSELYAFYLLL